MDRTRRTNEAWIDSLSAAGAEREAALDDLRRYLLGTLRRVVGDRPRADDAFLEDAVQESLLRVLDRLDQFAGRSRFTTWASALAIRTALAELRRRQWRDVSLDEVIAGGGEPDALSTPEPVEHSDELVATMYRVIDENLTERQRNALLAELRGMPQDEIARHLDSNRNAIYKLTHDARRNLRRGLEAAGYTGSDVLALLGDR